MISVHEVSDSFYGRPGRRTVLDAHEPSWALASMLSENEWKIRPEVVLGVYGIFVSCIINSAMQN